MSGALQRMRDYFGDQLLIRVGREMKLTPLAQSLAGPVRALLTDIRQTLGVDPQFDPKTTRRDFTIAMSDYAAFMRVPRGSSDRSGWHQRILLKALDWP